jgi:uncharacterized protein YPO0396
MKYYPRLNQYKASNCLFDCETSEAYSYGWWCFAKYINGLYVFNNYRYSNTTAKHQFNTQRLLDKLGIKIDVFVTTNRSLTDQRCDIEHLIVWKNEEINAIRDAMTKPRTHKAKNIERQQQIDALLRDIQLLSLGGGN